MTANGRENRFGREDGKLGGNTGGVANDGHKKLSVPFTWREEKTVPTRKRRYKNLK